MSLPIQELCTDLKIRTQNIKGHKIIPVYISRTPQVNTFLSLIPGIAID